MLQSKTLFLPAVFQAGWALLARASAAGVAETGLQDPSLTGHLAQGNRAVQ